MNAEELDDLLKTIMEVFEDGDAIISDYNLEKVYKSLEKPQRRNLTVMTDIAYGEAKAFQAGMLTDEYMWGALFVLALVSFDIGKDAGR